MLRQTLRRIGEVSFWLWCGSDGVGPDGDGAESVCILNGIHRGAVIEVGETALSIGGVPGCNAVLADASVADCSVEFLRDVSGSISVALIDGQARIGGKAMKVARPVSFVAGAVLRIGDVSIARGSVLDRAQKAVRLRERRRTALNWAVAVSAALMVVGGASVIGGNGVAGAFIASTAPDKPNAPEVASRLVDGIAATALEREVERVGLTDVVLVERETMSGQILVTGEVSTEERALWDVVAQWFDGRFGGQVMLEADLVDRDASLVVPFRITSVVMTPNPRIIIQDGRVFPIGATLPGGWEIRRIADMKVVLAKGNKEVKIAF